MNPNPEPEICDEHEDIEMLAREVWNAYVEAIPEYAAAAGTEVEHDVLIAAQSAIEVYLSALHDMTPVSVESLRQFDEIASRRLHEGFPLEALLRASRIELRVVWRYIAARAEKYDMGRVGDQLFATMDALSSESERSYIAEQEHLRGSRQDATRLFLARVVRDSAPSDNLRDEALFLGYNPDCLHTAIIFSRGETTYHEQTSDSMFMLVSSRLRTVFPNSISALLDSCLFLSIAGSSSATAKTIIDRTFEQLGRRTIGLTAGIGSPQPGLEGLRESFAEAKRATGSRFAIVSESAGCRLRRVA